MEHPNELPCWPPKWKNQIKMGLRSVKDGAMINSTLDMQECELSLSLQQLKMKVVELTQTRDTPFQNQILNTNWWYWF
jgi:hypothetical protein